MQIMNKFFHGCRAIKKFTQAIKSDPTYVKAYVCRAEAFIRAQEVLTVLDLVAIVYWQYKLILLSDQECPAGLHKGYTS